MTEVDLHVELFLQSFVLEKEDVVVERDRFDLGKSFLHAHERALHIPHGNGKYHLQKHLPDVPVDENESQPFPAFARDNEVTLHVTEPLSFVDTLGSFGDHAFAVEDGSRSFSAMFAFEYLRAMRFDAPSVHAFDIPLDGGGRDVRDGFLNGTQPSRDRIGRLIVE